MDSKTVHDLISASLRALAALRQVQADLEILKLHTAAMLVDTRAQIEAVRQHLHNQTTDITPSSTHATTHIVMWDLRSVGDRPAHCAYQHVLPATHVVTVTVGTTERFREEHNTEAEALDEAADLLAYYLVRGGTEMVYRDPRLNQGSELS